MENEIKKERERIYSYIEDLLLGVDNELLKKISNIVFDKEVNHPST